MNDLSKRALTYYRKQGLRRSMHILGRKLTCAAPPPPAAAVAPAQMPVSKPVPEETNYFEYFGRTLNNGRLGLHPQPASKLFKFGSIPMIAELNLPQCKKYRVLQKLEAFDTLRVGSSYSYWEDVPRSLNLLQTARAAIIYRVQANETFWSYVKEATRLGMSIGYDIDDPVFDGELYNRNSNLDFLDPADKRRLVSDSDGHLRAIRACDFLITSTPGMIALARRYYKGPIYLWRNAIDSETLNAATHALSVRTAKSQKIVTIAYISGSRAHEADFREAESALAAIMEKYDHIQLLIIGYLNLPRSLKPFAERIEHQPLSSYSRCLEMLANADINIVPLVSDGFNECKSAIRFLDAAILGVPTVASAVGDFVNVVADERLGLLVREPSEWEAHLISLIESDTRRKQMGTAAREMVLGQYTTEMVTKSLDPLLIATLRSEGHSQQTGGA